MATVKAPRPTHHLYRFCSEQRLTINTAPAGGNATLLAGTGSVH